MHRTRNNQSVNSCLLGLLPCAKHWTTCVLGLLGAISTQGRHLPTKRPPLPPLLLPRYVRAMPGRDHVLPGRGDDAVADFTHQPFRFVGSFSKRFKKGSETLAGGLWHKSWADATSVGANKRIACDGDYCSWRCRGQAMLAEARSYHPQPEVGHESPLDSFKSFTLMFFSKFPWFFCIRKKNLMHNTFFIFYIFIFVFGVKRVFYCNYNNNFHLKTPFARKC